MERPNLTVITDALCMRLLFDGRRAAGVEVERGNALSELRADREAILCAGAYNSPQILMLSGIGIGAELQRYGIRPRVDLAVGENLQDHANVGLAFLTDTETLVTARTETNLALLLNEGRGPLTSNIGEAGGFFRTRDGLPGPDFQIHAAPVMFVDEGLALPVDHALVFGACLLRPTSRGKVFLRSLLPSAKPHVLHNYFTTEEDRQTMVQAVRRLLEIAEQPALAAYRRGDLRVPASDSDADILDHIRHHTQTLYHPVGTCAIGAVGRQRTARPRRRWAAGGGRLGDAGRHPRQHQRSHDHDRGEGRRSDPRPRHRGDHGDHSRRPAKLTGPDLPDAHPWQDVGAGRELSRKPAERPEDHRSVRDAC